jgi:hypothetical protein
VIQAVSSIALEDEAMPKKRREGKDREPPTVVEDSKKEPELRLPSTFQRCVANHLSLREYQVEAVGSHCQGHACAVNVKQSLAPVGTRMFRCDDQKCTFSLCSQCARPRFRYAEKGEQPEHLVCSVCLEVLWEPVQHNQCGNSFCLSCLEGVIKNNNIPTCPMCKDGIDTKDKTCISPVLLKSFKSMLDNVHVHCSMCSETFTRDRLLRHELQICLVSCAQGCAGTLPLAQHAKHFAEACPMTELPCRQGCGQQVRRGRMDSHVENECTVTVACPQGCHAALPRFQFEQQAATCPNASVPCNRGCQTQVLRGALDSHLQLQCPAPLPCPRSCGLEMPQRDFGTHADTCAEVPVVCVGREFQCTFTGPRRLKADHERACAVVAVLPALRMMHGGMNDLKSVVSSQHKLIENLAAEKAELTSRDEALQKQHTLSEAQLKSQYERIKQLEEFRFEQEAPKRVAEAKRVADEKAVS